MSMTMLTILQICGILIAYSVVTLLLPFLLLRKRFRHYPVAEQLIFYFLAGNFYIIYLVFLLQFLHISCQFTLLAGTAIPFLIVFYRKYRGRILIGIEQIFQTVLAVLRRENGVKTLASKGYRSAVGNRGKQVRKMFLHCLPDLLLTAAIIAGVCYVYGINAVTVFGYKASDIPVHNQWVNEMDSNQIFSQGVYPHGFHCMIYYLHAAFGIKTYILFRVFAFVQTLYVHLALLVSIKVICKARFTAYFGTAAYLMLNIYGESSFSRYASTLPQEYGMLFIIPSAVLAIRFFQEFAVFHSELNPEEKVRRYKRVKGYLISFAISFSLTLTVHFYNTMPTGVFCLGIAAGFFFRFFQWKYFWRIMVAGVASIIIAVFPMAVGVATGHELQGSLYWGLNVINGTANNSGEEQEVQTITDKNGNTITIVGEVDEDTIQRLLEQMNASDSSDESESIEESIDAAESNSQSESGESIVSEDSLGKKESVFEQIQRKLHLILMEIQVYCTRQNRTVAIIMVVGIISLMVLGGLAALLKKIDYAGMLWSVGFYMLFMCIMQSLVALGLPELMQPSRLCIFFCYSLGIVWALNADAIIYLLCGWFQKKWVMSAVSALIMLLGANEAIMAGLIRKPIEISALEPNEGIMCLTNIIRENKDNNWTIISANDERQMIIEFGRHYEMITFLRELRDLKKNSEITMPTEYVYFFIEKQPINYAGGANGIDLKPVSEEGASQPVNMGTGIEPYTADIRWVTMSHMYYWAQAFKKLYPEEMEVYYETDDFVCYRLHQNVNSLYNLAIDYGYNNPQAGTENE